jgi:hypothetical protein
MLQIVVLNVIILVQGQVVIESNLVMSTRKIL